MFSNRKIILVIVLLLTGTLAAYILVVVIPAKLARQSYEGAKEIGRDIREIFQFTPEITVDNKVILQQQTPIFELATVSQTFHHEYVWTNTWLKSTKKIKISGTMKAKAGFDLNKKFIINITDDKAYITMPQAKLLSLEPQGDIVFYDENGVWNWVKPEDRSKAINAFAENATAYAQQADFVRDAQQRLEVRLHEILMRHGKKVEIVYDEVPASGKEQPILQHR